MHQPQKSNSVSSFVTSSSSGLSLSRQQLNLATSSQVSPGGLGHSSSSSILSQSSLVSNFDDKAYTQNALKQIRNSLQPFATKVANGGHYGSGERRPSSASSNASSCNSASAAATVFGGSSSNGHHQLSASGSSLGPYSTYLHPPSQPGTYLYGQVNKLPTGAASTQICLGAMTPSSHCHQQGTNTSNGSLNGDTANGSGGSVAPAAMVNVEEQKQLTRQLLEMAGLPEDTLDALSPRDLNLLLGRIYKQLQQSSAVASHNHAQQQPDPAKAEQPPSANQMSSQSQCQSSAPSAHYPNPPLQYHQLPSHPTVIDRMSLYQATPSGTLVNGTGQADSLLPSAVSSTSSSPLFTRDRLQPKILSSNSAQPLTENYRNYLHQKVNQADSGSTGYSTSSSTGSNAQPSTFSLNTQTHSSSSLASSNSSSTSSNSPYHRMVPTVPQKGTNGHLTTAPEPSGGGISGPHEAATAAATSIALQKRLLATKLAAQSNPAGVASFRPTDPLPPPPLPPHRDTTKAPVPPPIPPHSSTFHSKSEVNQASSARATSALASAVANSPQLQQFLRQHLATLDTASATENLLLRSPTQPQIKSKPRPGALSYASSASSASPPQREQSSSPVSFGRARLKAAALAAAEQHQTNGNSSLVAGQNGLAQQQPEVTPKLINNGTGNLFNGQVDPLLAAQVSQKLANLNLSRTGTNYHHVNSPPPSYAASSSSGLQSPTPTMSSSSDYACTPTRQTGSGLPYGAAALHHKLSPMASVSHSHTARGPPSSQHNGARDSLSSSALGSAVSSTMVSPSPSDGDQTTHSQANLTAWASRHAVSQSPIIMQSVKSQKVQKPVLQTAVAPTLPPINPPPSSANSTLKGPLFGHRDGAPAADSYAAMQSVSSKLAPLNANCSNLSSSLPSPASSTASSLKSTSIKLPDQCGLNPPPYANGYNGQGRFSSASSTTSATPSNTNDASDGYHACPPPPYASAIVRTNGANLAPANAATTNKLGPNSGQSPPPPPPPPYSISLSIAQQDSIAQIFSNFTSPPPPSNFGGSNSSVTSSSTAGAAQKTGGQCFQVPTTDPPSYASSMAALAAQRSATLSSGSSSTTSTNVYSPAASSGKWPREANNNSAIASSSSLQSATAVAVAVSMASHRPLPLGPASRSSAFHSEPPDTEVPPLPPKPSASGSSNAPPPPPLPPQPLHIQAAAIAAGQKMHSEASAQEGNLESAKEGAKEGGDQFGDFDQHFTAEHRLLCEMIKQEDGSEDLIEKDADGSMRKQTHCSPIPTRRNRAGQTTLEKEVPRVTPLDASAFKFYMEQHMENLTKAAKERQHRSDQLEAEIQKANLTKEAADEMRKMLLKKESNHIRLRRAKMDRTMFRKIKTIGVGAFGEVALVRKTDVNVLYAMKRLRKADVLTRKQVAHVKAERDILAEADNEWVVKLYYSFQDEKYLYFVMDYIPGGDLMSLLIKWNLFSEDLARFYIAELVLAVESVHKMGFIHRDIKPDNVLIDKDGHIKLTDFGLCTGFRWTHDSKYYHERGAGSIDFDSTDGGRWSSSASNCNCPKNGKETDNGSATGGALSSKPLERRKHRREHHRCEAHSLVGTPNYIAPEVLLQIGYTQGCDWWSVGVILHEMVVGSPPFYAATPAQTQQKVINWRNTLRIPPQARLSAETADLITKLCCDAEDRLGRNGADEIKAHPFFESINFDAGLRNQRAPYIPDIKHAMDTSNFDPVPPKLHDSDDSTDDTDSEAESQSFDQFGRPVESPDRAQPRTTKGKPKPAVPVDPKHPQHAFLEFTFRRFFDNAGNAYQMAHFAPGGGSDAGSGSGTHAPASSPSAEIYGGSLAESNMSENTTTTTTSSNIDGEFIYDEVYSSTSSISVTVATASNAHAPVSPLPSAPLICAPAYLTTGSSTSVAATSVLQPDAAVASTIHSSASPPAPLISSSSPLPPPPFEGSSSSTTSLINAIIKDHRSAATATAAPAATGSTTEPTNDPVFV